MRHLMKIEMAVRKYWIGCCRLICRLSEKSLPLFLPFSIDNLTNSLCFMDEGFQYENTREEIRHRNWAENIVMFQSCNPNSRCVAGYTQFQCCGRTYSLNNQDLSLGVHSVSTCLVTTRNRLTFHSTVRICPFQMPISEHLVTNLHNDKVVYQDIIARHGASTGS